MAQSSLAWVSVPDASMGAMGEQQWDEQQWDDVGLDIARYVARVRRIADLSQRELAQRLGVGPATVGRWESGGSMAVDVLERVLGLAGLRLQVVDESGQVVPPFGSDAVRDNAGRRFPAHLDVVPPDGRWTTRRWNSWPSAAPREEADGRGSSSHCRSAAARTPASSNRPARRGAAAGASPRTAASREVGL